MIKNNAFYDKKITEKFSTTKICKKNITAEPSTSLAACTSYELNTSTDKPVVIDWRPVYRNRPPMYAKRIDPTFDGWMKTWKCAKKWLPL